MRQLLFTLRVICSMRHAVAVTVVAWSPCWYTGPCQRASALAKHREAHLSLTGLCHMLSSFLACRVTAVARTCMQDRKSLPSTGMGLQHPSQACALAEVHEASTVSASSLWTICMAHATKARTHSEDSTFGYEGSVG